MIRDGSTPRLSICSISAFDAQSKPVPREASRPRTWGSGLHLTATCGQVAFVRIDQMVHTIMRLDSFQVHLPSEVLSIHLTKVGYEESIFFSGCAVMRVNACNTLLQSPLYEILRILVVIMSVSCLLQ